MIAASAVSRVLGGVGRRTRRDSDLALVDAVRDGLPVAVLERLIADAVISEAELEARFIPHLRFVRVFPAGPLHMRLHRSTVAK